MTGFLDPRAARPLWCAIGNHVVYHPSVPARCPYPGCDGTTETFADATAAQVSAHTASANVPTLSIGDIRTMTYRLEIVDAAQTIGIAANYASIGGTLHAIAAESEWSGAFDDAKTCAIRFLASAGRRDIRDVLNDPEGRRLLAFVERKARGGFRVPIAGGAVDGSFVATMTIVAVRAPRFAPWRGPCVRVIAGVTALDASRAWSYVGTWPQ